MIKFKISDSKNFALYSEYDNVNKCNIYSIESKLINGITVLTVQRNLIGKDYNDKIVTIKSGQQYITNASSQLKEYTKLIIEIEQLINLYSPNITNLIAQGLSKDTVKSSLKNLVKFGYKGKIEMIIDMYFHYMNESKDTSKSNVLLNVYKEILEGLKEYKAKRHDNYDGNNQGFEFDIKMHKAGLPEEQATRISDDIYQDRLTQRLEEFVESLQEKFSWITEWYQCGRSGGWLILEQDISYEEFLSLEKESDEEKLMYIKENKVEIDKLKQILKDLYEIDGLLTKAKTKLCERINNGIEFHDALLNDD